MSYVDGLTIDRQILNDDNFENLVDINFDVALFAVVSTSFAFFQPLDVVSIGMSELNALLIENSKVFREIERQRYGTDVGYIGHSCNDFNLTKDGVILSVAL